MSKAKKKLKKLSIEVIVLDDHSETQGKAFTSDIPQLTVVGAVIHEDKKQVILGTCIPTEDATDPTKCKGELSTFSVLKACIRKRVRLRKVACA